MKAQPLATIATGVPRLALEGATLLVLRAVSAKWGLVLMLKSAKINREVAKYKVAKHDLLCLQRTAKHIDAIEELLTKAMDAYLEVAAEVNPKLLESPFTRTTELVRPSVGTLTDELISA